MELFKIIVTVVFCIGLFAFIVLIILAAVDPIIDNYRKNKNINKDK